MNFIILRFDALDSTNTEAANQAKRGANEGLCVIAKQQTAGRGRHGRTWISPENAGLYFSIVLRPKIEVRFLPLLTLMSAIVVCDVLREFYELEPDIKWANDVFVNDKKICGILAEAFQTKAGLAVIVGIGINLNSTNFPPELFEISTSIASETGKTPKLENLLEELTGKFLKFYKIINSENGAVKIREEWTKRSSFAFDKEVRAVLTNEIITGITCGIEENGALRIRLENGSVKIVQAGDVEMIRKILNK